MSLICKFLDLENEYHVDFSQSGHVVTLHSVSEKLPEDTSGFTISREGCADNWDYSAFVTIYNKIDSYTYQYSDDGSVYVPLTVDVYVKAIFDDGNDAYKVRPDEVDVQMYKNGKKSVVVPLYASKNYTKKYADRLASDVFTIEAPDLEFYTKTVSGTTVSYYLEIPNPRPITTDDLAECILAQDKGEQSSSILNIYASYCENNLKNFYTDVPESLQHSVEEVITADKFMVNEDGTTSYIPINRIDPVEN